MLPEPIFKVDFSSVDSSQMDQLEGILNSEIMIPRNYYEKTYEDSFKNKQELVGKMAKFMQTRDKDCE